jgi:hypothetical protein
MDTRILPKVGKSRFPHLPTKTVGEMGRPANQWNHSIRKNLSEYENTGILRAQNAGAQNDIRLFSIEFLGFPTGLSEKKGRKQIPYRIVRKERKTEPPSLKLR